jgi:hypothetical protein
MLFVSYILLYSRFDVYRKILVLLDAFGICNTLYPLKMTARPLKHVGISKKSRPITGPDRP